MTSHDWRNSLADDPARSSIVTFRSTMAATTVADDPGEECEDGMGGQSREIVDCRPASSESSTGWG
jgi:hypothetical protein